MNSNDPIEDLDMVYKWGHSEEGLNMINSFHKNQDALNILTCTDFNDARKKIARIRDRIAGKAVVEIGAGIGFTAIEMAKYAEEVVAIESDPAFSWIFTRHLYKHKPNNLTWIFGEAQAARDIMPYDCDEHGTPEHPYQIAVIFTRSGIDQMKALGKQFAPEVIMFYQEYENESK